MATVGDPLKRLAMGESRGGGRRPVVIALVVSAVFLVFFLRSRGGGSGATTGQQATSVRQEIVGVKTTAALPVLDVMVDAVDLMFEEGNITFGLFPEYAPQTVANFLRIVKEGFYEGCLIYRAERNFCLQGGCHNVPGKRFPYPPVPLEYKVHNFERMVSMARSGEPNSATTEFSIMLRDNSNWLSPFEGGSDKFGYAVFAHVIGGWDVVQKFVNGPTKKEGSLNYLAEKKPIVKAAIRKVNKKVIDDILKSVGCENGECAPPKK